MVPGSLFFQGSVLAGQSDRPILYCHLSKAITQRCESVIYGLWRMNEHIYEDSRASNLTANMN